MGGRLAIYKRVSLEFIDNYDEKCYVNCSPITLGELDMLVGIDQKNESEALKLMLELLKKHVVSGQVKVIDNAGQEVMSKLEPDHVDQLPMEAITVLFETLTGGALLDPKGQAQTENLSSTPTVPSTDTVSDSGNTTETS